MNKYVADTMAIVLYLEDRKLPEKVKLTFKETVAEKNELYISVVSLMEIGYLFEKKRIDTSITAVIELTQRNKSFAIQSLGSEIVLSAFKNKTIPELHDRLIAATASVLKAELITNDPIIQLSGFVKTIWG